MCFVKVCTCFIGSVNDERVLVNTCVCACLGMPLKGDNCVEVLFFVFGLCIVHTFP